MWQQELNVYMAAVLLKVLSNPHLACLAVLLAIIPISKINKLLQAQKEFVKKVVDCDSTLQALVVQEMDSAVQQAPVFQKVATAIHQINHYRLESTIIIGFLNTYPLNSGLSSG